MRVSIITNFLNADKYLAEAIHSVLAQTYQEWELLLIDDGSTDGSTAIAQDFARRYPDRIRYLEHDGHCNLGKSSSRNLGLRNARGQYIAFLDADDVFLPYKLARQVAILEAHPRAAMVYGRTLIWHSWTGKPDDAKRDVLRQWGIQTGIIYEPPRLLTLFLKNGRLIPCICASLVRRVAIEELGAFEESIQDLYEDQVLLAKLCTGTPIFVDDATGEQYRQHDESTCAVAIQTGQYHPFWPNPARRAFLGWLARYLGEKNIDDADLARALRGELRVYRYPRLYVGIKALKAPVYMTKLLIRFTLKQSKRAIRWA